MPDIIPYFRAAVLDDELNAPAVPFGAAGGIDWERTPARASASRTRYARGIFRLGGGTVGRAVLGEPPAITNGRGRPPGGPEMWQNRPVLPQLMLLVLLMCGFGLTGFRLCFGRCFCPCRTCRTCCCARRYLTMIMRPVRARS